MTRSSPYEYENHVQQQNESKYTEHYYKSARPSSAATVSATATTRIDNGSVQRIARVSYARQQPNYESGRPARTLPMMSHELSRSVSRSPSPFSSSNQPTTNTTTAAANPFRYLHSSRSRRVIPTGSLSNYGLTSPVNLTSSSSGTTPKYRNSKPIPVVGPFAKKSQSPYRRIYN